MLPDFWAFPSYIDDVMDYTCFFVVVIWLSGMVFEYGKFQTKIPRYIDLS
jgi:hypothetical protein